MKKYFYNIITGKNKTVFGIILKFFLFFLSFLFFLGVKARFFMYKFGLLRSVGLSAPVISIGNLTWGGTGKTPLVEAILIYMSSKGLKTALLTRGYGQDEDRLISSKLPDISVIKGKKRAYNAVNFQKKHNPDIFVIDDGFQHLKIKRDIDIVTINATQPFGNRLLIPAGILREPIGALRRAHIAMITKSDLVSEQSLSALKSRIKNISPDIDIFCSRHTPNFFYTANGEKKPLEYIKDKNIICVSGLADNDAFIKAIRRLRARVCRNLSYIDHYSYSDHDLSELKNISQNCNLNIAVTTEKDWVKLKYLKLSILEKDIEFLILRIELEVDKDEAFYSRLSAVLPG
jgi:tetraacyldisaccharide 4'-kinase